MNEQIVGAAIDVHSELGPALLESTHKTRMQFGLPINFNVKPLKKGMRRPVNEPPNPLLCALGVLRGQSNTSAN